MEYGNDMKIKYFIVLVIILKQNILLQNTYFSMQDPREKRDLLY